MLRRVAQLRSFAQYSWERIHVHREERGRLPRLTELPVLVRKAFRSWRAVYLRARPALLRFESASLTFRIPDPIDPYDAWLEVNQPNARREQALREASSGQSPRPIRALMCAFNLNRDGAPHSQYELTVGLKEKGVIDPIVYSPTDGPLRKAYERQGISVRTFKHPLTGISSSVDYDQRIREFATQVENWNVELIYGNTLQTFYAIEAAHQLNLPSVWNPRESEPWQTYFDFLPTEIARRALECFSYPYRIVFVSGPSLDVWGPLNSRHNYMVIHNGLNRERFAAALRRWPRDRARRRLRIAPAQVMILLPGTICERKGQLDLIEAVNLMSEDHASQIKCLLVGRRAPDYFAQLSKAYRALPSRRRSSIKIVAETSDPARYYAAADIFVCCSRIESFPRVILEAMAARLPIVTTPVFGIAEQVQDNVSALFYQPGDARALAGAITRLLDDATLRQSLAANTAPALDALIDFDSMVDKYAEVFREAWLSGGTRSRAAEDSQTSPQAHTAIG
jgi:glycosyltransferase involved in cell wall biosynthesis